MASVGAGAARKLPEHGLERAEHPEPEAITGPRRSGERPRRRAERKPRSRLGSAHDAPCDEDRRVTALQLSVLV